MDDRNTWPWLAGRGELIDRVAAHNRTAVRDLSDWLASVLGVKTDSPELTWAELLDAVYRALEATGHEIAKAKDQDSAAAARLKHEIYERALDEIVGALLDLAHRTLQHRNPVFRDHPEDLSWLIGYGCRTPGGPLEPIKPLDWQAGTPDWQSWCLKIDQNTGFQNVRLLDLETVDAAVYGEVIFDFAEKQSSPAARQTVAAETACREWLTERFKAQRDRRKPDVREEAEQRFPGLSGKSFDRAWTAALAEETTDLSWRKPGPPSSS